MSKSRSAINKLCLLTRPIGKLGANEALIEFREVTITALGLGIVYGTHPFLVGNDAVVKVCSLSIAL